MYKVMKNLADVAPTHATLQPSERNTKGQQLEARGADQVPMMYKVMKNLADVAPTHATLQPSERNTKGQQLEARGADQVPMMYKVMKNLVDVAPTHATLQPSERNTKGQQRQLKAPYSGTNKHLNSFPSAMRLCNSVPPEAQTAASFDAFKSKLGGWAESVS